MKPPGSVALYTPDLEVKTGATAKIETVLESDWSLQIIYATLGPY